MRSAQLNECQALFRRARLFAKREAPILLLGPRGTGKSTLARQIHGWSKRAHKPFVAVDCSAVPEGHIEAEFFGYEKGAFTGAVAARRGHFAEANGGTLFLDEIGEFDERQQAKFLMAAQEGRFWPIGAERQREVDVRIIAATNRPPSSMRPDLLDRLTPLWLEMLPLTRRGDALEIARTTLLEYAERDGCEYELGPGGERWIEPFHWPGNIRQLRNVLEYATAVACGEPIGEDHLLGALMHHDREAPKQLVLPGMNLLLEKARELTQREGWFKASVLAANAGVSATTARDWLRAHAEHNGKTTNLRLWRFG